MSLAIAINDRYVAHRDDDGKWHVLDANTGQRALPDSYDRLADATEAAQGLS